jgi:hypothetical protein
MNDIIENPSNGPAPGEQRGDSLRAIGHISYALHAVVAIGAVLPGVQASIVLLLVAFFLDLFKREDAGRRSLHCHDPVVVAVHHSGLGRVGRDFDLVPVPRDPGLARPEQPSTDADLRASPMSHDPNCIFCKIVAGQIPSRKAYEDDELLVFHDIAPWAPVHLLLIPKEHVATMYELEDKHAPLLGRMLSMADFALPLKSNIPLEKHHGFIQHLALADRAAGRRADLRHQEAQEHRLRPRRRGEGLQGRSEGWRLARR